MDLVKLLGDLAGQGITGLLLALSLWANLKQYQRNQELHELRLDERAKRLDDKDKATEVLLERNDRVHSTLDRVADVLQANGMKTPP